MKDLSATLFAIIMLAGCQSTPPQTDNASTWDFDHQVQYKQHKLADNKYHIEVIPNARINFEQLATFIMRRSLDICNSYGFKIEVLEGVESYTDRKAHPNRIFGSLSANLECPAKQ